MHLLYLNLVIILLQINSNIDFFFFDQLVLGYEHFLGKMGYPDLILIIFAF